MSTRRVVITGASSGIGQATARLFAQHGWSVVGVARRADRLAALAAETGISTFVSDVTKQADVDALRDFQLIVLLPLVACIHTSYTMTHVTQLKTRVDMHSANNLTQQI